MWQCSNIYRTWVSVLGAWPIQASPATAVFLRFAHDLTNCRVSFENSSDVVIIYSLVFGLDCCLRFADGGCHLAIDIRKPFDLRRGWILYGGLGVIGATASVVAASTLVVNLTGQPPPREVSFSYQQIVSEV